MVEHSIVAKSDGLKLNFDRNTNELLLILTKTQLRSLGGPMQYLAVIRNTDTFDLHREDLIRDAIQLAVMLYRSNDFPSKAKPSKGV